jgi:molecular chaperone GrpE (heat shock protein)
MAEEPQKENDPSAEWPEDVKKAYNHLKIPSLYDAFLANEKLSSEVRKQERSLKGMSEALQSLVSQITTLVEIVQEEWEEYDGDEDDESEDEENRLKRLNEKRQNFGNLVEGDLTDLEVELLSDKQSYLEDQSQLLMMEAHDILLDHSRLVKHLTRQLVHVLPKKEGVFSHEPVWLAAALEISQSFIDEAERSRYRLLSRLEQLTIQPIEPKPGDSFDPALHRILEHVSGGQSGTIGQVVRVGYRQQTQILRLAEVIVYH